MRNSISDSASTADSKLVRRLSASSQASKVVEARRPSDLTSVRPELTSLTVSCSYETQKDLHPCHYPGSGAGSCRRLRPQGEYSSWRISTMSSFADTPSARNLMSPSGSGSLLVRCKPSQSRSPRRPQTRPVAGLPSGTEPRVTRRCLCQRARARPRHASCLRNPTKTPFDIFIVKEARAVDEFVKHSGRNRLGIPAAFEWFIQFHLRTRLRRLINWSRDRCRCRI